MSSSCLGFYIKHQKWGRCYSTVCIVLLLMSEICFLSLRSVAFQVAFVNCSLLSYLCIDLSEGVRYGARHVYFYQRCVPPT